MAVDMGNGRKTVCMSMEKKNTIWEPQQTSTNTEHVSEVDKGSAEVNVLYRGIVKFKRTWQFQCNHFLVPISWSIHIPANGITSSRTGKSDIVSKYIGGCISCDVIALWPKMAMSFLLHPKFALRVFECLRGYWKFEHNPIKSHMTSEKKTREGAHTFSQRVRVWPLRSGEGQE